MTDTTTDVGVTRASALHSTLIELLHLELSQRQTLDAQRSALQDLGSALAQLLHHWNHHPRDTLQYHSLQELLHLQHQLRQSTNTELATCPQKPQCPSSASAKSDAEVLALRKLSEVEALVEARVMDAEGLPVAHALVFGSLTAWGLCQLLVPMRRWVRWIAELLPPLLVNTSLAATDRIEQNTTTHSVADMRLPRCWGAPPFSACTMLRLLCRSLAHLLEFWRLSTERTPPCGEGGNESCGVLDTPLLAQLLVRGPGSGLGQPDAHHADLRRLRADIRFAIVDVEELRDVLRDGAAQTAEREESDTLEPNRVTALELAQLAFASHNVIVCIRQTVPGL